MSAIKAGVKEGRGVATQEISDYLDYAKDMRSVRQNFDKTTMRSFAIIPDIVAIDIYTKYGIDVHSDDFIKHPAAVNKLKRIIKQEYPKLLTGGISNRFKI